MLPGASQIGPARLAVTSVLLLMKQSNPTCHVCPAGPGFVFTGAKAEFVEPHIKILLHCSWFSCAFASDISKRMCRASRLPPRFSSCLRRGRRPQKGCVTSALHPPRQNPPRYRRKHSVVSSSLPDSLCPDCSLPCIERPHKSTFLFQYAPCNPEMECKWINACFNLALALRGKSVLQ